MKPSFYNIYIPMDKGSDYILYNTLSGAVFEINEEAVNAIQNVMERQLDTEFVQELKNNRIWVENSLDEREIYKTLHERHKYSGTRVYLTLNMTYRCNMACEYCYLEYFMKGKSSELMSAEILCSAIEFAKRTVRENNCTELVVCFMGGEPLLNTSAIEQALEKLDKWPGAKCMSFICSNGTTITEEIVDALSKYNVFYQITLAGARDCHDRKRSYRSEKGTYDDIIKALELLKERRIGFGIRVDVDRENYVSIGEMLDDLGRRIGEGLYIKFFPIIPGAGVPFLPWTSYCLDLNELGSLSALWRLARSKGFKVVLNPLIRYTYCGYLTNRGYIVDSLGDVYKCGAAVGVQDRRIGTLDRQGRIQEVSHHYYDWMSRDPLTMDECKNCKFLPACGGGCAGVAYDKHKTYRREDCREKYLIMERVKFYAEEVQNAQP